MKVRLAILGAAAVAMLAGLSTLNSRPAGAAAGPEWAQVYSSTGFRVNVPPGGFADCSSTGFGPCTKLPEPVRSNWAAYPDGWPSSCGNGSFHCAVDGTYEPSKTVWISGGEMHIRAFRGASGNVMDAAVVPRRAVDREYGKYVETFEVTGGQPGYKSAHLLWPHQGNASWEIDFPEGDWNSTFCVFDHTPDGSNGPTACPATARFSTWNTTVLEWWPGHVEAFLNGRQILATTSVVPDARMDWIIQNEASTDGESAAPGTSSQLNIKDAEYYAYIG
jgi:hypothetical protein